MSVKERTELQAIFSKMDPIIANIAQREGMTMVFEKTDSGLVFAPPHLDLTNELVRLYNDQYKGGKGEPKADPSKVAAPGPSKPGGAKSDGPKPDTTKSDVPRRDQAAQPKK